MRPPLKRQVHSRFQTPIHAVSLLSTWSRSNLTKQSKSKGQDTPRHAHAPTSIRGTPTPHVWQHPRGAVTPGGVSARADNNRSFRLSAVTHNRPQARGLQARLSGGPRQFSGTPRRLPREMFCGRGATAGPSTVRPSQSPGELGRPSRQSRCRRAPGMHETVLTERRGRCTPYRPPVPRCESR